MNRRNVDILIVSDTHLGTFGSSALPLLKYLRSVQPKVLILNGDIIDIWQFNKYFFPKEHTAVLKEIFNFASQGIPTYYLTGNHDDTLRNFVSLSFGNLHLVDSMELEVDGKRLWVFHGDAFDNSVGGGFARRLAQFGGRCYDFSLFMNQQVNKVLKSVGMKPVFISKKIKDSVKGAINKVNNFEMTGIDLGIEKGYDYVVCGHVHRPVIKKYTRGNGTITYLNSGDWLENLTALEYVDGDWSLFKYNEKDFTEEITFKESPTAEDLVDNTLIPQTILKIKDGKIIKD